MAQPLHLVFSGERVDPSTPQRPKIDARDLRRRVLFDASALATATRCKERAR